MWNIYDYLCVYLFVYYIIGIFPILLYSIPPASLRLPAPCLHDHATQARERHRDTLRRNLLAADDEQHGGEDECDAHGKAHSERLAEADAAYGYSRYRFERTKNCGGSRANVFNGYRHKH